MSVLMRVPDFGMLMSTPIYLPKSCNMLISMLINILHDFRVSMRVLISIHIVGFHLDCGLTVKRVWFPPTGKVDRVG